jgi:hypothetical protein
MRVLLALTMLGGCHLVFQSSAPDGIDAGGDLVDAVTADGEAPWVCPALPNFALWTVDQLPVSGFGEYRHPTVDAVHDEIYFAIGGDHYVTPMSSPGIPQLVTALSTAMLEDTPSMFPDGERMFFVAPGQLMEGTRNGPEWTVAPVALPIGLEGAHASSPAQETGHGFRVIVSSTLGDLHELTRDTAMDPLREVDTLGRVNDPAQPDLHPYLSADGCWLLFSSRRAASLSFKLFAAQRRADGTFSAPIRLLPLTGGTDDLGVTMSAAGNYLLWMQGPSVVMRARPM